MENAALSGHRFGNRIDAFAKHVVLDLTGLKFDAVAAVIYHSPMHRLTVHSGGVTDPLRLFSPEGTHFAVGNDGFGGTDVRLEPLAAANVASTRERTAHHSAAEIADVASQPGDFLVVV